MPKQIFYPNEILFFHAFIQRYRVLNCNDFIAVLNFFLCSIGINICGDLVAPVNYLKSYHASICFKAMVIGDLCDSPCSELIVADMPLTQILIRLFSRSFLIYCKTQSGQFAINNFYSKPLCRTISNTFFISRKAKANFQLPTEFVCTLDTKSSSEYTVDVPS